LKTINRTTRAGGLALGGDDGGATVNQTLTWLSGLPLRTGVHRSGLEHEPYRYDTARLLADRAVDVLLWVASFTADLPPPQCDLPTIVLGHPRLAAFCEARPGPTVFIPVSTPGIGSPGHLFRTDGGIVLPLTPVYSDTLPTVSTVAASLGSRPVEAIA
jgi:formylmethanofuran dehydrogenase subunit B